MAWNIKQINKADIKNPVLIEGLPGMGNVGKIAVDYLIDTLKAKKLFEITSNQFPHCVFVNEDNLVELPEIDVYYKNFKDKTLLFLAGDIQPLNEESCYEFCHAVLDTFEKGKGKEIVTLGGLALPKAPTNPKVYATGNTKKILDKYYKSKMVSKGLNNITGPIIGVSGLLAGLAGKRNIPAVSLLAETFAHPNYLDIKGAKEILKVISKQFNLKLNLKDLTEEAEDLEEVENPKEVKKIIKKKLSANKNLNYIG